MRSISTFTEQSPCIFRNEIESEMWESSSWSECEIHSFVRRWFTPFKSTTHFNTVQLFKWNRKCYILAAWRCCCFFIDWINSSVYKLRWAYSYRAVHACLKYICEHRHRHSQHYGLWHMHKCIHRLACMENEWKKCALRLRQITCIPKRRYNKHV